MSVFRGTPGPWSQHAFSDAAVWVVEEGTPEAFDTATVRIGSGDMIIGEVNLMNFRGREHGGHPRVSSEAEMRANAALIAQAPRMLQLLLRIEHGAPVCAELDLDEIRHDAKSILAALRESGAIS